MIHGLNLMKRIGEFLHGTLVRMLWNHAPTCASGKLLCSLSQKRITIGHGFRQACEVLRPPAEIKLQKAKASARQSFSGGTHHAHALGRQILDRAIVCEVHIRSQTLEQSQAFLAAFM